MEPTDSYPLPLELAQRIDVLCLQFEKAWRAAENPRLEDYLENLPQAERPALLELLRLEVELRLGRGEQFTPRELYRRFPGEQSRIDTIWREIAEGDAQPAPAPAAALQQMGDFRIVREIGKGGMGIVYEAEQVSLGRHVALKVLPRQMLLDANARCRFEREARAVARLHHTNIVPVFGVGEHDGLLYYAMQLIQGQGLDQVLKELKRLNEPAGAATGSQRAAEVALSLLGARQLPGARERSWWHGVARLSIQVAGALAYAHQQGIVHRDVKPSNLLLDPNGRVWVTDFGLARVDDQLNLTQTGDVLGTPRYMPPEAFEGNFDRRGDIYALGLTLYELLAFQPAFADTDRVKLIKRVTTSDAPRLDRLAPALPRDLVTIVHKCIDRDVARRYQTADERAADLERFLADEPIHARRASSLERLWRWSRHNRGLAGSLAVITCLVVAAAISSTVAAFWFLESARRYAHLADEKEQARQKAEQAGADERWERYRANIATAASALQMQNIGAARNALAAAPAEYRNWEWHHFHSQLDAARLVLDTPFALDRAVLSPDGKRAAAGAYHAPGVYVWDTATGKQLHALTGGAGAVLSAISPDGGQAAFGTSQGLVRLVDLRTGKQATVLEAHAGKVSALAFSPDSRRLASAGIDRTVRLWDLATARNTARLPDLDRAAQRLVLSPDGKRLLTLVTPDVRLWDLERLRPIATLSTIVWTMISPGFSPDGRRALLGEDYPHNSVQVWDALTGQRLHDLRGHQNNIMSVACSPDGSRIASASQDQTVRLWDGNTGKPIAVLRGHTGWLWVVAFSPDGKRLASTGEDGCLRVWDAGDGQLIDVLRGHTAAVHGVAWSRDGRQLASASADHTLRLWDLPGAAGRDVLAGHQNFVYDVACSPDGAQLASAAWDGTVRLWDLATGKETAVLGTKMSSCSSVAYAPGGKQLVCVTRGNRVIVWDLATGKPRHIFKARTGDAGQDVRAVFHPRGTRLAIGTLGGLVRLWDVQSGKPAGAFAAGAGELYDVAFSPDGTKVACAGQNGTIPIWHVEHQQLVTLLRGHTRQVNRVVYSKEARCLASASSDSTARLWNAETGEALMPPLVHASPVWGVAFSPDGTRLATACGDNTIRLWDVATGQEVAELRGHHNYVKAVTFTPDGARLISGSGDFTVRVWDTVPVRVRARTDGVPAHRR